MNREQLKKALKALRLIESAQCLDEILSYSGKEALCHEDFLIELITRETNSKVNGKINTYLKDSGLDQRKTLEAFEMERLDQRLLGQLKNLRRGEFLKRRENVLAFGHPGSGKTHLLTGLCMELCRQQQRVLFRTCEDLVEELLIQKNALNLSKYLKKLDKFDLIFIDDIGYVQKSREEMEVLFSLLAYRYERGSVMITSNLMFSEWGKIFKDPVTTVAVIDRVVHHSVILEMNLGSYRADEAKKNRDTPPS
jgi:DNA replication protein DnaC